MTLDADKTVSVAFASTATIGKCDESVVDGCAGGALNNAAHSDTDTDHHWRCDGGNGGANSRKCAKPKGDCLAGGRSWTVGGLTCTGSVDAASSGDLKPARDAGDPTRGVASFKCDDGAWLEQAGSACTVDLSCGTSENTCLTPDVEATGLSRTPKEDGLCAATEAKACTSGRPDRNTPADIVREDGACGTALNQCAGGTSRVLTPTDEALRWQCLGIDAEKRWSCLGTDGRSDWRCEYGGRSQSCSLPIHATSHHLCSEDAGEASDSPVCLLCRDGYEKHGGDCVPECGANEVRDANGMCVCEAGHSKVNGKCVEVHRLIIEVEPRRKGTVTTDDTLGGDYSCSTSCYTHVEDGKDVSLAVSSEAGYSCSLSATSFKMTSERTVRATCGCAAGYAKDAQGDCVRAPMCSSPLVENTCKPPATAMNFANSAENGKCNATEAAKCEAGTFKNTTDTTKTDGRCGTTVNTCAAGTPKDKADTGRKNLWDCLGVPGSKNWECLGIDGRKTWDCKNGELTKACQVSSSGKDASPSCTEPIPATDYRDCFTCKPCSGDYEEPDSDCNCVCQTGYEKYKGNCVPACGDNATRNTTSGVCECDAGHEEISGECKRVFPIMVNPAPGAGFITAKKGTGDGISCGYGGRTNCVEYYEKDKLVTPSKTINSGHQFTSWTGDCTGATCSLTMDGAKEISMTTKTTLNVNPGGPYTAAFSGGTLPFGGFLTLYTANVSASATGGVSPYTFRWEGQASDGATAIYIFTIRKTYYKEVAAKDSAMPQGSQKATAEIRAGTSGSDSAQGAGGAQDASQEAVPFEVPLGGELRIVWGEDSAVTASSGDAAVVGVSVASPEIRLTGVGAGAAAVIVQTDAGELRLPVEVK